jgi:hypothetical protein
MQGNFPAAPLLDHIALKASPSATILPNPKYIIARREPGTAKSTITPSLLILSERNMRLSITLKAWDMPPSTPFAIDVRKTANGNQQLSSFTRLGPNSRMVT